MHLENINSSNDLVTSRAQISKGFLEQALYKSNSAHLFITKARAFKEALKDVQTVGSALSSEVILKNFRNELLAAGGFSDKAASHLTEQELLVALKKVLENIKQSTEAEAVSFKDELVYRYLLTKGDALGGASRNKTGALAGEKLSASILQALKRQNVSPSIVRSSTGKIQTMSWPNRYLVFDSKPKIIGKNIDAILLDVSNVQRVTKAILEEPTKYLACGELKGGIDPAGADEHWKTANTALDRIRVKFATQKRKPGLFFVAAAIESSMAEEIFEQLENNKLAHAANLNEKDQLHKLASWLVAL